MKMNEIREIEHVFYTSTPFYKKELQKKKEYCMSNIVLGYDGKSVIQRNSYECCIIT